MPRGIVRVNMQYPYPQVVLALLLTLKSSALVYHERTYCLAPTQDTYIHGDMNNPSLFQKDYLEVGHRYDGRDSRILLKFDPDEFLRSSAWGAESSFPNLNRSVISNVTLRLSCVNVADYSIADVTTSVFRGVLKISKLLLPWDQTYVTSSVRNVEGGVWWVSGVDTTGRDATAPFIQKDVTIDYSSCQSGATVSFDVDPSIFKSWLEEPLLNYGLLVWADLAAGVESILKLASVENGHVERHPELVVLLQDTIVDSGTSCPSEQFQCLDGSCIDQSKVCNFAEDCLHGNDEVTCSIKCDFETPCPWGTPAVSSGVPGWEVHSGPTETSGTGPSGGQSHTGSDESSSYLYVDATGKEKGALSRLVSPLYSESGPQCSFHFFYHMSGRDVGTLRVILALGNQNVSVWETSGSQGNWWLGDVLSLGRLKEPFRVILEAEHSGGGDEGDVAVDTLEMKDCSPALPSQQCMSGYFRCDNLVCVRPDDVCSLRKDCLLGEDEDVKHCGVIPFGGACSFEDGWCGWHNVIQDDDFDWTRHNGSTRTSNTGPSYDHTLGNSKGFYVYTEASSIRPASKAFLRSVVFTPPPEETYNPASPHYQTCKVRFYYHLYGSNIGQLKLYAIMNTSETSRQLFSESYENSDLWQAYDTYLPAITESYYLQFESTRAFGNSGDMALDDISLSRQCFQLDDLTSATMTPDPTTEVKMTATRRSKSTEPVSPLPTLPSSDPMVFQFSTCGSKGEAGPNQAQCNVAYRYENVSVTIIDGIQKWVVPVTKTYSMQIKGAGGGTGVENTSPSRGAEMEASFNLTAGDQLFILVGQAGEDACDNGGETDFGQSGICNGDVTDENRQRFGVGGNLAGGGGGGGGGSFIAKFDETTMEYVPLLIAGGGGGLAFSPSQTMVGVHGSVDTPGPGLSGTQGATNDVSGAGGGWNSTGSNMTQVSGRAFLQGGRGGIECSLAHLEADWRTHGGFGGGGGGCTTGGGGGGYTGGDASLIKDLYGSGQGGTSYVHPSGFSIKKVAGANVGAGEVVITALLTCPAGTRLGEEKKTCINILPDGPSAAIIVGSIVPVVIIIPCIIVVFIIAYHRKKRKDREATERLPTESADYQLNQLRHNAAMDFNPCYQLGDGAVTVKDLKEVPRENLKLIRALGQGAFGEVYHGHFQPSDEKEPFDVAVKTLPERSTKQDESDFLMEALIMGNFDHANIVSLKGVCFTQAPRFILLEFMAGGELKQFLRDSRPRKGQPSRLDMSDLLMAAHDVTKGCEYLESQRFIHRDIAARNVLLSSKEKGRTAKIGDFGMARDIYRADYYRKGGQAMLPVKWMPPEAFLDGIFTSKTDVWSFGVLLWEIMSLGYMPYPGMSNQEVIYFTTQGQRMNAPRNCPRPIQDLMYQCWHQDPDERPNFSTILHFLSNCLQDTSILDAPLPQELLDDDRAPAVIRPRNSKNSPVLQVHGSGSQSFGAAAAHTTVSQGVVGAADDDEYLTPDWIPGGRMKEHLILEDGNINNSGDVLEACARAPVEELNHESVSKLKNRRKRTGSGHKGPRPDSDTSFDPPINQDKCATEATDLLDRGEDDMAETSFTRSATPRNSSKVPPLDFSKLTKQSSHDSTPEGAFHSKNDNTSCRQLTRESTSRNSGRAAAQLSLEDSQQGDFDTSQDLCRSSRAEPQATEPDRGSATTNSPRTADETHSTSFSPRILNRFRMPVFSRHSSLEVPNTSASSSQMMPNNSLPMLSRMQSLPVNPNPYTMTDLSSQPGLARSTPDTSNVIIGSNSSSSINDAANRRVLFNSTSGHVVFEDEEINGEVV
ncbi:ALK tyrosine kinase receptor-like [Patiria miniata]|uniref:Tyrosine-protein kinase receptor n=1 Tax=Patiria miniata TaxID=46514 RepID=A0A914B6E3_PATMI|nr:ALK tyrosine kinase receptor-like [Patiria miniata]XP_038071786.1 ALK tyrosine kinase receptor-like [Patiria miniata]